MTRPVILGHLQADEHAMDEEGHYENVFALLLCTLDDACINFMFPYIGNNHPNWLSYFSEGWPNHQPDVECRLTTGMLPLQHVHITALLQGSEDGRLVDSMIRYD